MKTKLTPAQKKALERYNHALRQEDRYLGSVFVTPMRQREIEAKTKASYDARERMAKAKAKAEAKV